MLSITLQLRHRNNTWRTHRARFACLHGHHLFVSVHRSGGTSGAPVVPAMIAAVLCQREQQRNKFSLLRLHFLITAFCFSTRCCCARPCHNASFALPCACYPNAAASEHTSFFALCSRLFLSVRCLLAVALPHHLRCLLLWGGAGSDAVAAEHAELVPLVF